MRHWNGYEWVEDRAPTVEERVAMLEDELHEISSPRTKTEEEVPVTVETIDIFGDVMEGEGNDDDRSE